MNNLNENSLKKECSELKELFINIINDNFNNNLKNKNSITKFNTNINIPNIEKKYKTNEYLTNKFHYKYYPIKLHNICEEFNDKNDIFIKEFNQNFKINYDIQPSIYFGKKTNFKVSFYTELL